MECDTETLPKKKDIWISFPKMSLQLHYAEFSTILFLVAFTHAPDTHLHMITMGKVHVNTKCQVSTFSLWARILFIYLFYFICLFSYLFVVLRCTSPLITLVSQCTLLYRIVSNLRCEKNKINQIVGPTIISHCQTMSHVLKFWKWKK